MECIYDNYVISPPGQEVDIVQLQYRKYDCLYPFTLSMGGGEISRDAEVVMSIEEAENLYKLLGELLGK
jgi:hypothetical protein